MINLQDSETEDKESDDHNNNNSFSEGGDSDNAVLAAPLD
jgi:hypothetical protein